MSVIIDYGPLKGLIGTWSGDKGIDIAPEEDGTIEENPYFETIEFKEGGDLKNAGRQHLVMLSYHQVVTRKSTNEVFHDEVGYWIWDAAAKIVMRSFTIPRGVAVVAGGTFDPDLTETEETIFRVSAKAIGTSWGIAQSSFMAENAKTIAFESELILKGDRLSFSQLTTLEIYGKEFPHTDKNELTRS